MSILDELNTGQKEAVLATEGPLLIVAGAGSGKTKTIAHRIAHIISKGADPASILAVTFTNKAALEMKNRITGLRRGLPEDLFVGTFHALGVSILRERGSHMGIRRNFSILDEEDSRQVIRDLLKEFELDPEIFSPPRIGASISRLKNELIDASSFAKNDDRNPYQQKLQALYAAYEARLQKMKGLDFDDLLLKTVMLLETFPEVKDFYADRWQYIHIDEYQDTNRAQYVLSRMLAARHRNIAVVGDVDQAIYSWRGADWRNILQFERDWPDAKVIVLEENYRSTKLILDAANAVIANNRERKEKNLWSQKERGDEIDLVIAGNEKGEALFVAAYVRELVRQGIAADAIAVLFRTNAQSRVIEEVFLKKKIPYSLATGVKFYERKEIKDVLAYLKYALNPDDLLAKKRIVNTPARGIGKATMLKYIGRAAMGAREKEKIGHFEKIMEKVREHIMSKPARSALKAILRDTGFENFYRDNKLEADRKENVDELLSVASKFDELRPPESIEKLLAEAALLSEDTEIETKEKEVTLLTAHAAKGLEFKIVIIVGMEEGLFPHTLSVGEAEVEEERRLFYVALTRAQQKVVIVLARRRLLYGETSFNEPSRFLREIPSHLIRGGWEIENYEGEIKV